MKILLISISLWQLDLWPHHKGLGNDPGSSVVNVTSPVLEINTFCLLGREKAKVTEFCQTATKLLSWQQCFRDEGLDVQNYFFSFFSDWQLQLEAERLLNAFLLLFYFEFKLDSVFFLTILLFFSECFKCAKNKKVTQLSGETTLGKEH